ncbi:hypothetical protein GS399_20525 [Pedobacter sp. HMF7647]|uniref:Uncharacterized protein n=1 Tax=Hufsiella arboris TaxID=2695275 RepID=A0A7K1YFK7_9SPHI|nr:hypothetical protein [Hufsiella arboris]MXV53352.1 hypothetical protein [Hufsiella arboris]
MERMLMDEWRELGFYYDFDDRLDVNQWRFYGSKIGLQNFVKLLDEYTSKPSNNKEFEHDHYGPYSYLKIITLDNEAIINEHAIGGSIANLKKLKSIIADKLNNTNPGQTFNIDKDFGNNNTATAKFFVMADHFDPVSMDELLVSGRQIIVNQKHENDGE